MTELIEFLHARLDEDEQAALDWQRHKRILTDQFMNDPRRKHVRLRREPVTDAQLAEYAYDSRFDPVRVLREVEAKRQILSAHAPGNNPCDAHDASMRSVPCDTVLLLALPYADHPDYREEWKS
ncbi:DUF6221 family protein [Streptosporangium sp. CA-135522]|uniref:DUF6221 family protein n=1 Tax=Streptosporangium sp. CA-135522 TaxID=3240072 RepID=UPI003D8D8864